MRNSATTLLALGILSLGASTLLSQTATPDQANQAEQLSLIEEYRSLGSELQPNLAAGANPTGQTTNATDKRKAARYAAIQARLAILAANRVPDRIPETTFVDIPGDASPVLEELLVQRAQLDYSQARLFNAARTSTAALRQKALEKWSQDNQPALQAVANLARTVSDNTPALPLSASQLFIPQDSTPAMSALLTERQVLQNERNGFWNAHLTSTPEQREEALDTWQRSQIQLLKHISQLVAEVSQETADSTTP